MVIFYNYIKPSSFIENDASLLKRSHALIPFTFSPATKLLTLFVWVKQLYFLSRYIFSYKIIYSHSAGYHTFLPSLLSLLHIKKHIIVLHGSESNVLPKIKYGNLQKPMLGWFTKFSIKNATELLPVSEAIINSTSSYTGSKVNMGLMASIPLLKTPYSIIYNGIDTSIFRMFNYNRNPYSFITVAAGIDHSKTMQLKGIDLILEVAKTHPHFNFTIVGSETVFGYDQSLPNVTLLKSIPNGDLVTLYNQHAYYLQLSMIEGFGVALCEAMACGCIPIVSNVGILPKIATANGYVLFKRDDGLLSVIFKDLNPSYHSGIGNQLRQSIIDRFENELRFQSLTDLLQKYNH